MTVYCVFVKDGGGYFLEKIFNSLKDAESYRQAQGKYMNQYYVEMWDVS